MLPLGPTFKDSHFSPCLTHGFSMTDADEAAEAANRHPWSEGVFPVAFFNHQMIELAQCFDEDWEPGEIPRYTSQQQLVEAHLAVRHPVTDVIVPSPAMTTALAQFMTVNWGAVWGAFPDLPAAYA